MKVITIWGDIPSSRAWTTKTKSILNKQIKGELNTLSAEFKKGLLGGMPKMGNLKIVKLESKQLIVKNSDNQEIPFYAE